MPKFKKIVSLFMLMSVFLILMLPVASAEVTADTYNAYADRQRYYFMVEGSSSVIAEAYTFDVKNGDIIPITNNRISNTYQFPHAYGYEAIILAFEFPESKYVSGQSYQLRFDVSESKNYIYTYFFPNAIPLDFTSKFFEVGDVYSPYRLNTTFLSSLSDNQKNGMLTQAYSATNEVVFDITVPEEYTVGAISEKAARTIYVYMYATYWATDTQIITNTTYSNIRLIPTGSTQYLYSDKVYQENVENELSDINQGLEEQNSQLQDANNKLDDILQQPEQEKAEAESSGNDSLDSVVDAIPNYQEELKSSFNTFLSVLADTGTSASWTFPALYIPKIDGVIPVQIPLSEEHPINFNDWINKIPENILTLVQNLMTAALIIFCVRELYRLIEYFFRGGRLSE